MNIYHGSWAMRVAERRMSNGGIVTKYDFDSKSAEKELSTIHFDKPDEEWLDFVCLNRSGDTILQPYDIVYGPVADDDVYGTILLYEQGLLDTDAAIKQMKVRELYDQILFHTVRALKYLRYTGYKTLGGA